VLSVAFSVFSVVNFFFTAEVAEGYTEGTERINSVLSAAFSVFFVVNFSGKPPAY